MRFNEKSAPAGWNQNRDIAEAIIFYRHTRQPYAKSSKDFLEDPPYLEANMRDESIKQGSN